MEDRIAVLEKDVDAIKSELAEIRHDRMAAAELSVRVSHIELDLVGMKNDLSLLRKDVAQLQKDVAQLQKDVAQLQKDVAQLQKDVATLKEEVVAIRIELMRRNTELSHYATKADLKEVEGNLKGWMLGIALTVMTLNVGINVLFYNALKTAVGIKPTQAQQTIPLPNPAPLSLKYAMSPLS
jgi:outer membrane murein-binding lipoprotein Lpp